MRDLNSLHFGLFSALSRCFLSPKNVVFNNTHKWILNTEISHCSADMKTENLENWYIIVSRGLASQEVTNSVRLMIHGLYLNQCLAGTMKYLHLIWQRNVPKNMSLRSCGVKGVWTGFWLHFYRPLNGVLSSSSSSTSETLKCWCDGSQMLSCILSEQFNILSISILLLTPVNFRP